VTDDESFGATVEGSMQRLVSQIAASIVFALLEKEAADD